MFFYVFGLRVCNTASAGVEAEHYTVLGQNRVSCQIDHLYKFLKTQDMSEANWFAAKVWHCQYLASQHLAKPKVAKYWQLFERWARINW